jgi:hypothetical protein
LKPLAIILKTLIVGYLWSIVFIDGLRVVLLINWHFDIFLKEHWLLLGEKWNSGEPITASEVGFFLILLSSIPLLFAGWIGLCLVKWKRFFKHVIYSPLYLYRKLTLKTKPTVVIKKKSIKEETPVIKNTTVIKKTAVKPQPLPSATLMQSNIYTKQAQATSSITAPRPSSSYTPAKKKQEAPVNHALFNFDEDDFDFDFDFDKKEKTKPAETPPPAILTPDESASDFEERFDNIKKEEKHNKQHDKPSNKKENKPKKEEHLNNNTDANPNRESQTPVIDVLTQKGYDLIPSVIIKSTKVDCIAVSKDSLFVCLVDKEVGDWLADEEKFNDEEPLWFSESSHRISPVRLVDVVCDALRTKLSVTDMKFKVIPHVIIQSGNVINAEDMFEIWEEMNINVTRINRGSPKEIRLFSKAIETCEAKADKDTLEKLRKLFRSMA